MINISVVLYNTSIDDIGRIIKTLEGYNKMQTLFLVDNSPKKNKYLENIAKENIKYIFTEKNLGYGKGHNIAMKESMKMNVDFHLVLNPDIYFEIETLEKLSVFMTSQAEIGHLMPKVVYPDNSIQYLCKLLPSPFNLFARSFLPNKLYQKLNKKYELRISGYDKIINVPYLSGCFMFLRVSSLKEVGVFDERFFMYPEDIDLTRRIHKKFETVYYPNVKVIHRHEKASYKSIKMKLIHIVNMIKYFNKYHWFFDFDRFRINKKILNQFK